MKRDLTIYCTLFLALWALLELAERWVGIL